MARHGNSHKAAKHHSKSNGMANHEPETLRGGIFDVLRADHQVVNQLIDELDQTADNALQRRENLFARLRDQLDFHSRAEETVFYARVRKLDSENAQLLDSVEEHHVVTILLGELDSMSKNHERWKAKLTVLAHNVRLHIEEEEQQLFPRAALLFTPEELEELGVAMELQKEAWFDLARQAPGAAAVMRGMTQIAERLPFGEGLIAMSVNNPQWMSPLVRVIDAMRPSDSRSFLAGVYRVISLPITLPMSLVSR